MRPPAPGWAIVSLGSVAHIQTGVAKNAHTKLRNPIELPYLRVANVQDGYLDLSEMKSIIVESDDVARYALRSGDVLMTEGGDFDKLGRGAVWAGQVDLCLHQNHVFAVRPNLAELLPDFLTAYCSSAFGKRYFLACSKQTTNLASINSSQLREMPLPVPPLPEQRRIVAVLDAWDRAIELTECKVGAKARKLALGRQVLFADLPDGETVLGDLAEVCTGAPAPQDKAEFSSSGPRFIRVSDLASLVGEAADEPEFLSAATARRMRKFEVGTILFAKSGMSAALGRVVRLPMEAHIVSHLGAVTARDPAFQSFIFHWLSEHPPSKLVQGDGFPSIRISEVSQMPVPSVSGDTAYKIGAALDALEGDIGLTALTVGALRTQKRGLMQKLLTGEWRLDHRFEPRLPGTVLTEGVG
ncbi:MAG: restriction endonuclease subunit S [Caulobacteraceae bacterium]